MADPPQGVGQSETMISNSETGTTEARIGEAAREEPRASNSQVSALSLADHS